MTQEQRFTGGKAALMQRLRELPALLSGKGGDPSGDVERLLRALGVEALSIVREAFVVKSRGGVDEAGISWPPLSPRTIAYGRRHPGLSAKRKAAAKKGRPGRPLLTAAQDKLWRGVFTSTARHLASTGEKNATAQAAAMAWAMVKRQGGKTILLEYGGVKVEVMRDTGRLLSSLSPGSTDNLLRVGQGEVVVGTNVVYARRQHEGNAARKLPARRLWPEADGWPAVWWDRLGDVLRDGVKAVVGRAVGGGSGGG